MYRSWDESAFTRALQKLLPELIEQDNQPECELDCRSEILMPSNSP